MKKTVFVSVAICVIFATSISCNYTNNYTYPTGHFPDEVINFEEVNSEYDDYNSDLPTVGSTHHFQFSSNRNSQGGNFDIVCEELFIQWNRDNGQFTMDETEADDFFGFIWSVIDSVNTPFDEFGPYSVFYYTGMEDTTGLYTYLLMYANNSSGDFDIRFLTYSFFQGAHSQWGTEMTPSEEIDWLNSDSDDLYPTFYGEDFEYNDLSSLDVSEIQKILFCSNRDGDFNLYEVEVPSGSLITSTLASDVVNEPVRLSINSAYDDKCPYVNGKLLVFTSNRPGGYGGLDLYYSVMTDGNWSEPVNFGEGINTAYDEYRPITYSEDRFDNNLLIFSSNRPGGKGGFDLYYMGIPQMIK